MEAVRAGLPLVNNRWLAEPSRTPHHPEPVKPLQTLETSLARGDYSSLTKKEQKGLSTRSSA